MGNNRSRRAYLRCVRRVFSTWYGRSVAVCRVLVLGSRVELSREMGKQAAGNFVFCSVGANPKLWEPFYDLDNQMKSSKWQEILVVCSKKEPVEPFVHHSGQGVETRVAPPMNFCNTKYDMGYGILTGNGLDFDLENAEIIFPNGRKYIHVSASSMFDSNLTLEPLEIGRGRIRKEVGDLPHLYKSRNLGIVPSWSGDQSSEILVGSEVERYFENIVNGARAYSEIKKKL